MTDIKRAMVLIEYDDGAQAAWVFDRVSEATASHFGLPGTCTFRIVGNADALRSPAQLREAAGCADFMLAHAEPQPALYDQDRTTREEPDDEHRV